MHCDIKSKLPEDKAKLGLNVMRMEELPAQKIAAMMGYARELRRKFPHMKPDRIKRKVAEKYHINLI